MKAKEGVIDLLNRLLTANLTAINQYFLHAKMCENWGYDRLAAHTREESMDEMRHAEMVIDRILYLEGVPNMQRVGSVEIGQTVRQQFENDLAIEVSAVDRFKRGITLCAEEGDHATRVMLEGMLRDEEEHIDWLEQQIGLIDALGEQLYLAQQVLADSED